MKYIIDITEEQFKDCKTVVNSPFDLSPIIKSFCIPIVNGISLEDIVSRIEAEKNKLNEEGELHYSKSEIAIFDKCLEFLKGEE